MKPTLPDFAVSSAATGFDEFLKVLNEYNGTRWKGNRMFYGIVDNCAWTSSKKWGKELTPLEAIALLTGTKQLTEGDLIVGNQFECIESDYEVGVLKDYIYCCENKGTITTIKGILIVQNFDWFNCHFKLLPTKQEEKSANQLKSQLQVMNIKNQMFPTQESVESQPEIVPVQEEVKGEDEIRTHDTVVCGWNDEGELVYIRTYDVEPSEGVINDIEHKKAVKAFQWVNENLDSSRMGDKCFLDLAPINETAHLQQQLRDAKEFLNEIIEGFEIGVPLSIGEINKLKEYIQSTNS